MLGITALPEKDAGKDLDWDTVGNITTKYLEDEVCYNYLCYHEPCSCNHNSHCFNFKTLSVLHHKYKLSPSIMYAACNMLYDQTIIVLGCSSCPG